MDSASMRRAWTARSGSGMGDDARGAGSRTIAGAGGGGGKATGAGSIFCTGATSTGGGSGCARVGALATTRSSIGARLLS